MLQTVSNHAELMSSLLLRTSESGTDQLAEREQNRDVKETEGRDLNTPNSVPSSSLGKRTEPESSSLRSLLSASLPMHPFGMLVLPPTQ